MRISSQLKNLMPILGALVLLSFIGGCKEGPAVVQHKVHKTRSGLEALREPKQAAPPVQAPATVKTRMTVAIFDNPDATWFFKVNGPLDQVDAAEQQWLAFFDSVKFEDTKPKWDAPETWTTSGPKPMRFATLVMGDSQSDSPLELAVSSLGPNQDMLLNANRWRGQLGLGNLTQDQLDTQLKTKESEHGKYLLFDAQGTGSGTMRAPFAGGGATPPFAGGAAPFAGGGPMTKGPSPAGLDLKFTAPSGWTAGRTSSMVQARFSKTADQAKAQITVIQMPADANEWAPNVKRWAGQAGLNDLTAEQLAERTSDIKVDQAPGKLVDLVEGAKSETAVIAAMVKRKGVAWFFKLSGEKELVDQSRQELETFMESVQYQ